MYRHIQLQFMLLEPENTVRTYYNEGTLFKHSDTKLRLNIFNWKQLRKYSVN